MNALRAHLRRATRQRLRRLCAALAVVLAMVAWMRVTYAQMQAGEVQIKAAFIYNFALFTTWPTDAMLAGAPMVLCVTAEHPLQAALEQLTGKPVRGHRLEIRQINDGTIGGCHLLVLDAQSSRGIRLDPATPVLTVGDGHKGALTPMIALALQDNRVVFDIDAGAARQAGLQLSSQLLRLARSVQ